MANIYIHNLQGGLRRGGLTPALSPRMAAITEDVRRQIETVHAAQQSAAKGYKKEPRLNEEKESTGIRFNEPAPMWPSGTR